MKEKVYVDVLRIVFTILLIPLFFVFTGSLIVKSTVYNPAYWRRTIFSREVVDYLIEDIMDDEDSVSVFRDLDLNRKEAEEMVSEYVDIMLDEVFEVLTTGDTDFDRDRLDDFIDEYVLEPMEDQGMTDLEIEDEKQELYDFMDETLEGLEDDLDEMGYFEGMDKAIRNLNITLIFEGVIIAGICISMIVLHKIKFRATRGIGIALAVSQVGNLLIVVIFWAVLRMALESVDSDFEELLMDVIIRNVGIFTLIHVVLIAAGIALAIISGCLVSKVKNRDEGFAPLEEL
ncbi:MAG: hypothetical protein IKT14_06295 [Clostridiales bacterium]|nr:hypothetical protein [Clostridiales bacterium]